MAYAATVKEQIFNSIYIQGLNKKKSQRGILLMLQGYMNKTCNNKNNSSKEIKNKNTPGVCPRCRKGKHWRNKY